MASDAWLETLNPGDPVICTSGEVATWSFRRVDSVSESSVVVDGVAYSKTNSMILNPAPVIRNPHLIEYTEERERQYKVNRMRQTLAQLDWSLVEDDCVEAIIQMAVESRANKKPKY